MIDCQHHVNGGCSLGKYGGRPSVGVCRFCLSKGENTKDHDESLASKSSGLRIGDKVASIAKPIARFIDGQLGTNLEGCETCEQRRRRLNSL